MTLLYFGDVTRLWNKSSAYINRRDEKGVRKSCLVPIKGKVSYRNAYTNCLEFMNQLLNYSSAVKLPIVMFLIEPIAEKVAIVAINHKDFFLVLLVFSRETRVP